VLTTSAVVIVRSCSSGSSSSQHAAHGPAAAPCSHEAAGHTAVCPRPHSYQRCAASAPARCARSRFHSRSRTCARPNNPLQARDTDFLLIRDPALALPPEAGGGGGGDKSDKPPPKPYGMVVKEIPRVYLAGQTEPQRAVFAPGAAYEFLMDFVHFQVRSKGRRVLERCC
jgi:hypothetical protein